MTDAERSRILEMLNSVPEEDIPSQKQELKRWSPKVTALFDGTADPMENLPGYTYLGKLPILKSREIKNSRVGIGLETLDRETFDPKVAIPPLGRTGVKYARCQTGWIRCEKEKGKYDFSWLDEVADLLEEQGIEPWFSISFGNPFYTPYAHFDKLWEKHKDHMEIPGWPRGYVGEAPNYYGEEAMEGYKNYVRAMVKHFLGRVKIWEVWNEPEHFWCYQGKKIAETDGPRKVAEDYTELVRISAEVIREVNPEAIVVSCTSSAGTTIIRELGRAGLGKYIDVHSFHSYGTYARVPEWFMEQRVAHMKHFLSVPGKEVELIQGESGRASGPSMTRATRPNEYNQAKFVCRRYFNDIGAGVKISSYFTASDFFRYYADGSDQYYGIVGLDGSLKLGFHAVSACATLLDGAEVEPGLLAICFPRLDTFHELSDYAPKTCAFRRHGVPMFAAWHPGTVDIHHDPKDCRLNLVIENDGEMSDPIVIDPIRHNVYAVKADYNPTCQRAVGIGRFPLTDYPLIITDLSIFKDFPGFLEK